MKIEEKKKTKIEKPKKTKNLFVFFLFFKHFYNKKFVFFFSFLSISIRINYNCAETQNDSVASFNLDTNEVLINWMVIKNEIELQMNLKHELIHAYEVRREEKKFIILVFFYPFFFQYIIEDSPIKSDIHAAACSEIRASRYSNCNTLEGDSLKECIKRYSRDSIFMSWDIDLKDAEKLISFNFDRCFKKEDPFVILQQEQLKIEKEN